VGKSRRFIRLTLIVAAGLIFLFFVSGLELPLKASKFSQKSDAFRQSNQKTSLFPTSSSSVRDYDFLVNNKNVRLTTLFGLGVQTIVIDPGHGGKDPGAIGPQGTMEKEITLDVARRLIKRLEAKSAFNIFLTREADKTVSLQDRVNFSNTVGADLFISIHVNSIPEGNINTIETYYFGPPSDEKTLRVAERENADSMYSSADFKKIIQNIGNTMKQQESIALAVKIQGSLFANVRKYDKDVHNWGVKIAPFMVLLDVEAPAVLTEISCISEPEEEKKLKTAEYREKIASFIEKGIAAYLTQKQVLAQRGDDDEH
jgi:N-acetylmuramoyl-L-alanine amidase